MTLNNAIRTNYIKAQIDITQKSSECMLSDKRGEMFNHIINECRKLSQKEFRIKQDWIRKLIYNVLRLFFYKIIH